MVYEWTLILITVGSRNADPAVELEGAGRARWARRLIQAVGAARNGLTTTHGAGGYRSGGAKGQWVAMGSFAMA